MVLQYGVIRKHPNLCFMKTDKKIKLSKDESLFIRESLSHFKELSFAFKEFFNFIKAFRRSILLALVLVFLVQQDSQKILIINK